MRNIIILLVLISLTSIVAGCGGGGTEVNSNTGTSAFNVSISGHGEGTDGFESHLEYDVTLSDARIVLGHINISQEPFLLKVFIVFQRVEAFFDLFRERVGHGNQMHAGGCRESVCRCSAASPATAADSDLDRLGLLGSSGGDKRKARGRHRADRAVHNKLAPRNHILF